MYFPTFIIVDPSFPGPLLPCLRLSFLDGQSLQQMPILQIPSQNINY